jgi:anti-sigma factor RsiW
LTGIAGISEDEIHDYVDGRLDDADRARIAAHLEGHPADRARVEDYRAITAGLHTLYDPALREPVPERMRALFAAHRRHGARRDPQ